MTLAHVHDAGASGPWQYSCGLGSDTSSLQWMACLHQGLTSALAGASVMQGKARHPGSKTVHSSARWM